MRVVKRLLALAARRRKGGVAPSGDAIFHIA
jgi:hypothetical protein